MKVISLPFFCIVCIAFFTCMAWALPYRHFHDFSPMTNKENGNPLEDEEEVKGIWRLFLSLSLSSKVIVIKHCG